MGTDTLFTCQSCDYTNTIPENRAAPASKKVACPKCGAPLDRSQAEQAPQPARHPTRPIEAQHQPARPQQTDKPFCQACGGDMEKDSEKQNNSGCIVSILGLLLCLTVFGAIVGIPILIYGMYMSGKRQGLWVCRRCGASINRKLSWYER